MIVQLANQERYVAGTSMDILHLIKCLSAVSIDNDRRGIHRMSIKCLTIVPIDPEGKRVSLQSPCRSNFAKG